MQKKKNKMSLDVSLLPSFCRHWSLRQVWIDTQQVPAKGVLHTTARNTHIAVLISKTVKYVVNALTAVFTHHAWTNMPFSDERDHVILHIM